MPPKVCGNISRQPARNIVVSWRRLRKATEASNRAGEALTHGLAVDRQLGGCSRLRSGAKQCPQGSELSGRQFGRRRRREIAQVRQSPAFLQTRASASEVCLTIRALLANIVRGQG